MGLPRQFSQKVKPKDVFEVVYLADIFVQCNFVILILLNFKGTKNIFLQDQLPMIMQKLQDQRRDLTSLRVNDPHFVLFCFSGLSRMNFVLIWFHERNST